MYLFVVCMDTFSYLISHSVDQGFWKSMKADRNGPLISHLIFHIILYYMVKLQRFKCSVYSILLTYFTFCHVIKRVLIKQAFFSLETLMCLFIVNWLLCIKSVKHNFMKNIWVTLSLVENQEDKNLIISWSKLSEVGLMVSSTPFFCRLGNSL